MPYRKGIAEYGLFCADAAAERILDFWRRQSNLYRVFIGIGLQELNIQVDKSGDSNDAADEQRN